MKTRRAGFLSIGTLLGLALVMLWVVMVWAQNPVNDLLALINSARLEQGLYPYAVSAELNSSAQRHSEDMAATGRIDHTGSDGSSSTQRILEAGYGVYEFGPVASENIYGGAGGAQAPFGEWLEQAGARSNLLSQKYRQVGIGVASDAQGRTFWTLNVGAQPNALPVLINDGATNVETITVTLRLVPENVVPEGLGTAMGQPVEYRASTSPRFAGAEWGPWAPRVDFELDQTSGQQTVYVQLRDTAGRTAVSQASVTLIDPNATATPTGTVVTAVTATPTVTSAATTPTRTPTASPTATTIVTATQTATATPRPTPTASMTPQPTATATPAPSATSSPAASGTPTSAPPPTSTTTRLPPPTRELEVAVVPLTPTMAMSDEIEPDDAFDAPSLASRLAPWALGLQIVALALGVYLALRRPSE
jgi:hypothetical protein